MPHRRGGGGRWTSLHESTSVCPPLLISSQPHAQTLPLTYSELLSLSISFTYTTHSHSLTLTPTHSLSHTHSFTHIHILPTLTHSLTHSFTDYITCSLSPPL